MNRYRTFTERRPAADAEILATPEIFFAAQANAARTRRWVPASETPYGGHEGLMVRAIILRHPDYAQERDLPLVCDAVAAAKLCRHLAEEQQERAVVLSMNHANHVRGIYEASVGTASFTLADVSSVLKTPLLLGCTSFVLVHNHPSGDPQPSREDYRLTERISEAAKCLALVMIDHVIIAGDRLFSFVEANLDPMTVSEHKGRS